jgi:YesN/AraC family two-component response regulator
MMLHIRNMESDRCKAVVKYELTRLGLHYKNVDLGEVEVKENISGEKLQMVDEALRNAGLELMYDKNNRIVERIKNAVYQLIYLSDELPKQNFSRYISSKINRDYTYLSNLFSGIQGITIEKYIISQKVGRIKELLKFEHLSLSNIAFKLKYSSVAHLSNQFKKTTGITPSFFKELPAGKSYKS